MALEMLRATLRDIGASDVEEFLADPRFQKLLETLTVLVSVATRLSEQKKQRIEIETERREFLTQYRIEEEHREIVTAIVRGTTLENLRDEVGVPGSTANKILRRLWERLGLENREELIFVFGWLRLISPDLECINSTRDRRQI